MLGIVKRHLALLGGLALAVTVLAGCTSAADKGEQRRRLDDAGQRVSAALDELVPAVSRELHTTVTAGTSGWRSCTAPVAGNAQASADVQFGPAAYPETDGVQRLASTLRAQGWKVTVNPKGSLKAHRTGLDLVIVLDTGVQTVSVQSECVDTTEDVDQEYADRPVRHLPVPWPDSGIS